MTRFRYNAVDSRGQPISGEIDAADALAARTALSEQSLNVESLAPVDAAESGLPLSLGDAMELSTQLLELSKAGVPLSAGLDALGSELPRSRQSRVLRALAARLRSGATLPAALTQTTRGLPPHLRGLLAASAVSGRLDQALSEYLRHERLASDLRHRVWLAVAYPLALLICVVVLFSALVTFVIPMFQEFTLTFDYNSDGSANVAHNSFIRWLSSPHIFTAAWKVALLSIVAVVAVRLASRALFARLVRVLPLVGPLVHYRAQTEFTSLLGLLLNQRIPLPQALRLTAQGVRNQAMRQACLVAAEKVEHGQSLSQCMAASPDFAMSLVPIVQWGERLSSLGEALVSAATLSRERIELQASLLGRVLPAFLFVVIATLTVASYQMLVLPMVRMISDLS